MEHGYNFLWELGYSFLWSILLLSQLQKDRQMVSILRVHRQILRVDRRVLRVNRQVLRMTRRVMQVEKRVLRVDKRVLRVDKPVLRVLRVAKRLLWVTNTSFASTTSDKMSSAIISTNSLKEPKITGFFLDNNFQKIPICDHHIYLHL